MAVDSYCIRDGMRSSDEESLYFEILARREGDVVPRPAIGKHSPVPSIFVSFDSRMVSIQLILGRCFLHSREQEQPHFLPKRGLDDSPRK